MLVAGIFPMRPKVGATSSNAHSLAAFELGILPINESFVYGLVAPLAA